MGSFHRYSLTDNHTNQILTHPSQPMYDHNSLLTVSHLSAMYELLLETVGNDLQATEIISLYTCSILVPQNAVQLGCTAFCDSTTTYFILEMTNAQIVLRDGRSMEQLHPLPLEIAVTCSRVPESERMSHI